MKRKLQCSNCHKQDKTVKRRACGYESDLYETKKMEVVCDECEEEHIRNL